MLRRRLLCAVGAALVAVPLFAFQLAFLMASHPDRSVTWPVLAAGNVMLLIGACTVAADFPIVGRVGRAVLVGIGIPLLLPGPTVLDSFLEIFDPGVGAITWLAVLMPNLVLLLLLGGAEAAMYLLATRRRPLA